VERRANVDWVEIVVVQHIDESFDPLHHAQHLANALLNRAWQLAANVLTRALDANLQDDVLAGKKKETRKTDARGLTRIVLRSASKKSTQASQPMMPRPFCDRSCWRSC
jgi:hypothetical protein